MIKVLRMEEVKKTIKKEIPMPDKSNRHFIYTKPAAEKKSISGVESRRLSGFSSFGEKTSHLEKQSTYSIRYSFDTRMSIWRANI